MNDRNNNHVSEIASKLERLDNLLREKCFKEALAEIRELELTQKFDEYSTEFGHFCYYSAEVFRKLGNYPTALNKANKAFDIFKKTNENKRVAQIKYTLGNIHLALGDLKSAQEELHDSLVTYKRIDDDRGKITVLFMLANISFQQGFYQRAVECLQDSIKLCDKIGEKITKANGLGNLGRIYTTIGKLRLAQQSLLESVRVNEETGDQLRFCRDLLSLGYVLALMRKFEDAIGYYEKALRLIYENNYMREMAIYYEYYAELAFAQGKYFTAKDHCRNGIKIGEEIAPDSGIISQTYRLLAEVQIAEKQADACPQTGACLSPSGQYDEALSSCEKALKVAESLGERIEIGAIHRALGHIYTAKREKEKAKESFEKAISILEQIGAKFELGKAYIEALESDVFEYTDRVFYYGSAREIFKELESDYWLGKTAFAFCKMLFETGEYQKAEVHLKVADKIFKRLNEKKDLDLVLELKEKISRILGKDGHIVDSGAKYTFAKIVTKNKEMLKIIEELQTVKDSDLPILLEGETGTGKDLFAKAIHYQSKRRDKSFVPVNCSALPETLLENELFGHKKGAYTGADKDEPGLFEEAEEGTFYFDEIGEIPLSTQVKLLRVIEEREITRLGETKPRKVDVRIIASSSRDLSKMVFDGSFRKDLYHRLNIFSYRLPPLRERKEDLPLLIEYFLRENNVFERFSPIFKDVQVLKEFLNYDWQGNVRELKNELERLIISTTNAEMMSSRLVVERIIKLKNGEIKKENFSLYGELAEFERKKIVEVLEQTDYVKAKAAELLGIPVSSLKSKIKKYCIFAPD